jgi:hypothetical protein
MAKFKYKSRPEISKFLAGIKDSVDTVVSLDTSIEATMEAQRTGPHLSHHLTSLVEQELTEAGVGKDQEWTIEELARHIVRVTISNGFAAGGLSIAGFEQLTLDLIYRYEGGDYSYSIEETRMNKRSEELRTVHSVPNGTGVPSEAIPEMIKKIMELMDGLMGDHGEVRLMNQDELLEMLKEHMDNEEEEDPEEEEE